MSLTIKISTLWIVVLFTMIFADILTFITPGAMQDIIDGAVGVELTESVLLIFAILLEIPIVMIFLSRYLSRPFNRWANIAAACITSLFVIGGGSLTWHYIFFASVEIACMLLIIWYAWSWPDSALADEPA